MVNMHEAKTQLSRLVDVAVAGGDVVIARSGRPLVRLVPYREDRPRRSPGLLAGRIEIAEDFDATPADVLDAFEGSTEHR